MEGSGGSGSRKESRTGYGDEEEALGDAARAGREGGGDAAGRRGEGGLDALHPGGEDGARCELCGGPVRERHCKIVCLNCGYQRDCSDP